MEVFLHADPYHTPFLLKLTQCCFNQGHSEEGS